MIPSGRTLILAAGLLGPGLLAALDPSWHPAWLTALALLACLLLLDLVAALWTRSPATSRRVAGALPLGVSSPVDLRLRNRARHAMQVQVYDHHPTTMTAKGLPQTITIAPGTFVDLRYRVTPLLRGEFHFPGVQLRLRSPLGLWWRERRLARRDRVRVYPNFAAVAKYALLANSDRLQQMGVRKRRRRGQGSEFHQLREFRQGDSLRQVDWLATARHQKLISREYQDERAQNIVMLLDCGRRMRTQDDALSHFDHALNAMLLLTYVALRQGDSVGVATFSGEPRWLKPVRGQGMHSQVLNTVYDLQPSAAAPDYSQAAMNLLARQRKRSLVVVLTGIRDEAGEDLQAALQLLRRRHRVLLASLREQAIDQLLGADVAGFDDAVTLAAAHQYLQQRERGIERLRGSGVDCLDVAPPQLSIALVNHYLAMKAGGWI